MKTAKRKLIIISVGFFAVAVLYTTINYYDHIDKKNEMQKLIQDYNIERKNDGLRGTSFNRLATAVASLIADGWSPTTSEIKNLLGGPDVVEYGPLYDKKSIMIYEIFEDGHKNKFLVVFGQGEFATSAGFDYSRQ